MLTEYPDDNFNKGSALKILGDINKLSSNFEKAIDYYKQAVDCELVYPQVKTNAYLDYSELVVKSGKTQLFPLVEDIILKREPTLLFPIEKYKVYSILAIINEHNQNFEKAKYYKELADKNAGKETSDLRYHKYLGIVKERDHLLDRLLKLIKIH